MTRQKFTTKIEVEVEVSYLPQDPEPQTWHHPGAPPDAEDIEIKISIAELARIAESEDIFLQCIEHADDLRNEHIIDQSECMSDKDWLDYDFN